MFWDNFYNICKAKGTTPNAICKEIGLSNSVATNWKNGTMPKADVLLKIAELLNCSTDYLLGHSNNLTSTASASCDIEKDEMTAELVKMFERLTFQQKISLINYAMEISK